MNSIQTGNDSSGNPIKINYTDYGTGKPIILLSGWPLSKEMWEYQLTALVNTGHRVIAYDGSGFSKSSQPWDGYDYNPLSDDLKALIDQLDLEDVTLVGFSMGGGEVVRYFSRHGGVKISKVVLISAITPYMLKATNSTDVMAREMSDSKKDELAQDRIDFLEEFGQTFFGVTLLNNPLSKPLLEYYNMLCTVASPPATMEHLSSFSSIDFGGEMKLVKVPALIIHGEEDTAPVDATGKQSTESLPSITYIIYEGAPHGLFHTDREKLNADLVKFLTTGKQTSHNTQKIKTTSLN